MSKCIIRPKYSDKSISEINKSISEIKDMEKYGITVTDASCFPALVIAEIDCPSNLPPNLLIYGMYFLLVTFPFRPKK